MSEQVGDAPAAAAATEDVVDADADVDVAPIASRNAAHKRHTEESADGESVTKASRSHQPIEWGASSPSYKFVTHDLSGEDWRECTTPCGARMRYVPRGPGTFCESWYPVRGMLRWDMGVSDDSLQSVDSHFNLTEGDILDCIPSMYKDAHVDINAVVTRAATQTREFYEVAEDGEYLLFTEEVGDSDGHTTKAGKLLWPLQGDVVMSMMGKEELPSFDPAYNCVMCRVGWIYEWRTHILRDNGDIVEFHGRNVRRITYADESVAEFDLTGRKHVKKDDVEEFYYDDPTQGFLAGEGTTPSWERWLLGHKTKPARIHADGSREWFANGALHRKNMPARILANGLVEHYKHGLLHNKYGPARVKADGTMEWWRKGVQCEGPLTEFGKKEE